jgi:O-antigen/teichoic acid export membrane protein
MTTGSQESLGHRTLRGMFWTYGSYVGMRLATLVSTSILARLLTPKDFGLIALATVFIAFLDTFQGLGVGDALVIAPEDEVEPQAETAFALSSVVGLILAGITAALGPVAAAFFHQPRLVEIMPVLGLAFFIYGLGGAHYALAMKRMDFRSRTIAEVGQIVARGLTGVILALLGFGVWSLVLGYVAGTVVMTALLLLCVHWKPRFRPQRKYVRSQLAFGGSLTAVGIMGALLNQFDNTVVGRVLGATQLGFYALASRLPYLFIISLASATGQVLFPAFATLEGDALRRGFLTAFRYTASVALPLTAVLIVLAEPITVALFGAKWHEAIVPTQVLCLWAVTSPISMVSGYAIRSRGRAGLILMLAIPQAVALIIGSILLVHHGIVAISWLQAVIAIVAQIVTMAIAQKMFGISLRDLVKAVFPPVAASGALAVCLLLIHAAISSPWPTIVVAGVAGAVVYLGLIHLLAPDMLPRLFVMAFPRSAKPA